MPSSSPSFGGLDLPRFGPWLARFGGLVVGVIAGVLTLSLLGQALAASAVRSATMSVDWDVIVPEANDLPELAERSIVFSPDGVPLATLHDEINRREVTLDEVPDHVWQAILTAEDRKFFEHEGYDVEGIGRAAMANLRARDISQGGSTITQQLAKSTVGTERTFDRKIEELLQAMALEEKFTKEELLERYLNQVYFGGGAYGVAAAAEEFFAVDFTELRVEQAALLAALIRAPGSNDPRRNPDGARLRRDAVLKGMVEEGYLDAVTADFVLTLPLGVVANRERQSREPYIVEAVKAEFFSNPAFGETVSDRIDLMFRGGLQIYTTIDPNLQVAAERIVREHYPERQGITASIASVDPRTGAVKAAAFGRDFDQEQFNLAIQGQRQPGSAFKPFVMATALEQGYPVDIPLPGKNATKIGQGLLLPDEDWLVKGVQNYGGGSYGDLNMRESLVRSVNTAFAQLIMMTGVEPVQDLTRRLGIRESAYNGKQNPSIALGGLDRGVSPLEMASAYGAFATGGLHVQPHVISHVVDQHGQTIYEAKPEPRQVLRPEVAGVMVDVMQDVVRSGTGTRARLEGWEVAGKTGTTQRNRDVWFVGYTPVLSTAVWVGNPDEDEILGRRATGGGTAAPMWKMFMEQALAGVEPVPFPVVHAELAIAQTGKEVAIPDVRQLNEADAMRHLVQGKLVPNIQRVASTAPAGIVVWQNPKPGTGHVGDVVTLGVSTGKPPPPPPPPPKPEPTPEPPPPPEPVPVPPAEPEPEPEPEPPPPPPEEGAPEEPPPPPEE